MPADVDPAATARNLRARLALLGDTERAAQEKRYLKSEREHLGVPVPLVRAEVRQLRRSYGPRATPAKLLALARQLWASPVYESRLAAVELLAAPPSVLGVGDLSLIETMIAESRTWALSDRLSGDIAGSIVDRAVGDPAVEEILDRWAGHPDFWLRRAALLALLPGLRRGAGDFDRFGGYADSMLEEKEFFVRKAIGWVLRETAKRRPDLVRDWLAERVDRVAGLTLREAVKYLPDAEQEELLIAYRER